MSNQHYLDEIERLRRFENDVLDIVDQPYCARVYRINFQWRQKLLEALDQLEDSRKEELTN